MPWQTGQMFACSIERLGFLFGARKNHYLDTSSS
jgi:hypothetical protein